MTARVNDDDVPRELLWREGQSERRLVIKEFTDTGFRVQEDGTLNDEIEVEARLSQSVPGYEARVLSELIERGLGLEGKVNDRSEHIQLTLMAQWVEDWAKESWARLGEAVPRYQKLFRYRDRLEANAADINDYVALAVADLREVLRKVT